MLQQDPQAELALLLPLSGRFAAPAQALRDGFFAAYFAAGERVAVRVFDSGDTPDQLKAAYQQALAAGAGMIVGPLEKEQAAELARLQPPLPVLALNYQEPGTPLPEAFVQVGLAPEDEALAAAAAALAAGQTRVAALLPEGEWGQRLLQAYTWGLQAGGGSVTSVSRYTQGVSDQKVAIRQLLGVEYSQQRHAALTRTIGTRSEFEAHPRSDLDAIFLAARPQDARLLIPQLRFYQAGPLPKYATSLAYSGEPDAELKGLHVCDMPFMLATDARWADERARIDAEPRLKPYARLYALGGDAYRLAVSLRSGGLRIGDSVQGATGLLQWSEPSTLTRRVDCAVLGSGGPQPLGYP